MSATEPQHKAQRRASRFLAGLSAVLHWRGREFACSAVNLSRNGVLLAGRLPVDAGPQVRVEVASAGGDLSVLLGGRISRVIPDPEDGEHQLAVEFGKVDAASREVLDALLARVIEGMAPAALDALSADMPLHELRRGLDQVSLAHRIMLAGRAATREREILINDSNPQVLDSLARNPNLLPAETRTLLRIRNLLPRTLQWLWRSPKWGSADETRILIAAHPNTPLPVAEEICAALSPDALGKLLRQPGLNPTLRMKLGARVPKPPTRR